MNEQVTVSPFAGARADLERQLERLDRKRRAIASALESLSEVERRLLAAEDMIGPTPSILAPPDSHDLAAKRYQTISQVLRDFGKPMSVPEMAREMMRRGDPNSMDSLRDIVHAICRRKPDLFEKLRQDGRVLWGLREWTAAGVARGGDAHRNGASPAATAGGQQPVVGDLTGKTVVQAAKIVLVEHGGEPMHYQALADEMIRRGYRSGRSNPFRATSVASMLNGQREQFENMGGGRFRLAQT